MISAGLLVYRFNAFRLDLCLGLECGSIDTVEGNRPNLPYILTPCVLHFKKAQAVKHQTWQKWPNWISELISIIL